MSAASMYYASRVALGCVREAETQLEALTWLMRAMLWREQARARRAGGQKE